MFNPGGSWSGSDGCNAVNGKYTLGAGGQMSATSGPSTLIGCDNWAGPGWVSQSGRVAISGPKLVFYDHGGNRLGAMVKAGATSG
jgi:hypothetical protein